MGFRHGGRSRSLVLELWHRNGGDLAAACAVAGVSERTARGWVAQAGGVIRIKPAASGYRLTLEDRELIEEGLAAQRSPAEIARVLGRHRSTVIREIARHQRVQVYRPDGSVYTRPYSARVAQAKAEDAARRPKTSKLSTNQDLVDYIEAKMSGKSRLSPEQVSAALVCDFADDESMRISAETIYQELYVQGRGSLRADLHKQLRTGRARRAPRKAARRPRVPGELLIANRPKDVDERTVPGHWEGDLIIGKDGASAIGTLVERHTRFLILLHLPQQHDAVAVADQIAEQMARLPVHVARSLTWDQGSEMVGGHQQVALETGLSIWFCDPASPWQRGSNENTNGLLRQYFPKGTDLSVHTRQDLDDVADGMNSRIRKTLGWRSPAEALNEVLSAPEQIA